jgi:hypothetical protein
MQKCQYKRNGRNVYLMQFPPTKRTIFVGEKSFYLPFPYLLFQYYYGSLSLAFSQEPITSLDQIICFPWLSNTYLNDWYVCLGDVESPNIKSAINRFWNSSFYESYGWVGDTVRKKVVGSYNNWSKLSLNTVCKRVSKIENRMNVRQFLELDHYAELGLKWI